MGSLLQDLRLGARMLIKTPMRSSISILTSGPGIGLTATVFSIVNGVMFKGSGRKPHEDSPAGQLLFLVMKRSLFHLGIGLVLGTGLALLAARPLQPFLYRMNGRDPAVSVAVFLALTTAGLLASFIPARRATKINPVVALAAE